MEATEGLRKEHEEIKKALSILYQIHLSIDSAKAVEPSDIDELFDFFETFADKRHHRKEESALFPMLEAHGVSREGGPVTRMLYEHRLARSILMEMEESLDSCKTGEKDSWARLSKLMLDYVELLSSHINKEDNILFPIANEKIKDFEREELLKKFNEIEQDLSDQEKEKDYGLIINNFRKIYL